ncbi:retrotransposon protein, putative, ty1-copia subclass [Tanacetum coccineum]
MVASQTTNNNSILDREKLNGSNFLDWYRNLRIVLGNEKKLHHLEEALPEAPPATTTVVVRNAYTHRVVEQQKVAYLMLAEKKLFEIVKAFHACKQKEGQSFSTYVLKMKAYLDQMERLGYPMPLVLGVNLILTSFSKDYDQERYTQDPTILAIRQVQIQKPKSQARGKGKNKGKGKLGHWKRNFLLYLAELKKNKASMSGTSGIFTIELYSFLKSNSWIYDTGCGTRICNTIQELRGIRKLNKGALDLYVSNGNRAAIEAIRSFDLMLPSGMKRIRKPQHDGLLKSTDDESFDICVSYISGKMARKPFTHASERADDLLGIIHSDVCGHLEPRLEKEHELGDHGKPSNYRVALSDPESKKWLEAMNAEMQSIKDNQTAFLNGHLNEDVYMVQPEGFVNPKHPRRVYKLQRSIYKLKQASRSWNKRFDEEIKKYDFTLNPDEPCVGEATYILGIKIYRDRSRRLILSQNAYIDKILKRFKMDASKRITIPMQPNVDWSSMMYAVRCTRLDVAFSYNLTSRYQQMPGESHWTAVKNILKYLRNTKDMFLVYGGDSTTELSVTCYTDASWAEYIAASEAAMEAIWIHKFISRLGVVPDNDRPMDMYCDNTGAITIADEPCVQNGAKHF